MPLDPLREPLEFQPLPMERVWGGRCLETLLGKPLPPHSESPSIGELWELVDRPEAQSVVFRGPLKGKTLHELWQSHRREIFGSRHEANPAERFPLLFKLLDARDRLSVQVHPPAEIAVPPLTEPKTECWYFLHAAQGAEVYAGLRSGITRRDFETALSKGTVEQTLHRIPVHDGESLFLPSGRLHAIGAGLVIVEVQQNSDTTYRVFDWNRTGLNGKPRPLHVEESLESIDFTDIEPGGTPASEPVIADCPFFRVEKKTFSSTWSVSLPDDFRVITCVEGTVRCGPTELRPGGFLLTPASSRELLLEPQTPLCSVLVTSLPPVS